MLYASKNIQLGLAFKVDRNLFFGTATVAQFPERTRYERLLRDIGAYKSSGEAIRAGFKGEIPYGWNTIWVQKKEVSTLKIKPTFENWYRGVWFSFMRKWG